MQTADFNYDLPLKSIAQAPSSVRENAKLLVQSNNQELLDLHISDLPDLLDEKDLLVVNKSRVQKARLKLQKKTGGNIEVFVLEPEPTPDNPKIWTALIKPARRIKTGTILYFKDSPILEIVKKNPSGYKHHICPTGKYSDISVILDELGEIPLPPYIHTPLSDPERYQTVYSKDSSKLDSVAAPTAGLHLSNELLDLLKAKVKIVELELAIGLATFTPIKTKNISEHEMHSEKYVVPAQTLQACQDTKKANGRVIAVGTTVVRALETAALEMSQHNIDTQDKDIRATSQLFIQPDFNFQIVDALITNFHMPHSTLLVLLAAFMGDDWKKLYDHAIKSNYRFLSFGDAMFVGKSS